MPPKQFQGHNKIDLFVCLSFRSPVHPSVHSNCVRSISPIFTSDMNTKFGINVRLEIAKCHIKKIQVFSKKVKVTNHTSKVKKWDILLCRCYNSCLAWMNVYITQHNCSSRKDNVSQAAKSRSVAKKSRSNHRSKVKKLNIVLCPGYNSVLHGYILI